MTIEEMRIEIHRISGIIANSEELVNRNISNGAVDKANAFDYYTIHMNRVTKLLDIQLDLLDAITLITHPEMSSAKA